MTSKDFSLASLVILKLPWAADVDGGVPHPPVDLIMVEFAPV